MGSFKKFITEAVGIETVKKALVGQPVWDYKNELIANVRGKYSGTQLFGSGTLNWETYMSQGWDTKTKLEEQLLEGTGGFVGGAPASFLVF
jgi:hypothetical protein